MNNLMARLLFKGRIKIEALIREKKNQIKTKLQMKQIINRNKDGATCLFCSDCRDIMTKKEKKQLKNESK